MQLINSGCGCCSEQHAGILAPCRGAHAAGIGLRHVTRRELVAQVDAWIALAPSISSMQDRVQYAAEHGVTGRELLDAAERRAGLSS